MGKHKSSTWMRAFKRFFTQHFIVANAHVFGDAFAIFRTFADEPFMWDLAIWQITRKLSMDGLKSAAGSFLADDPFMRQLFGGMKIF